MVFINVEFVVSIILSSKLSNLLERATNIIVIKQPIRYYF